MKVAIEAFTEWRRFKVKAQTVAGYDRDLRWLCLFLRNPEIEEVTLADLMEYLNGLLAMGWDANSMLGKVMAIRKFFEFYRRQGLEVIDEELVPLPQRDYKLPRVADEKAYRKLIDSIPDESKDPRHIRNAALIRLLWDTGARNNEVLSLDVEDLDLEKKQALIRTEKSKGRRPFRSVFWSRDTNERIIRWLKKRKMLADQSRFIDARAVFVSVASSKVGQRLTIKGVGELLRRQCNRAGIPPMNAHSFRHRMGHEIIKRGGSTADVMNILGHSSVQSTTIYTMMAGKELEDRYRTFYGE